MSLEFIQTWGGRMSFFKRLFGGASHPASTPPTLQERLASHSLPINEKTPATISIAQPQPQSSQPQARPADPLSGLSREERSHWETFQRSRKTQLGEKIFWPQDFADHIQTLKGVEVIDAVRSILAHPQFPDVLERAEWALEFEAKPDDAKLWERMDIVALFVDADLDELEGDPSQVLEHTDKRPLSAFDQGVNLRWRAVYRRIAGTMSDAEKLVYAMGKALHRTKLFDEGGSTEIIVSALWGGGRGSVEWQLDPNYGGDNAKSFLAAAQEHYGPPSFDHHYDHNVALITKFANDDPGRNVDRLLMPRLHGGNRWATSR